MSQTVAKVLVEIPNSPHLELDKIRNYAVAKVKEAMLAFCGR